MTFEEALLELGLDRSADSDVSRRAYLKLIKVRKPETDPDGFKRAREAYERVKAQLEQVAAPFASLVPVTGPQEPRPAPARQPAAEGVAPALPAAAPRTLEEFRAELASLPPGAAADAPVAIARQAVAGHPDAYDPISWLVQALVGADRHEEAIAALRSAIGRHPRALVELAFRFPSGLSDGELDQLAATAPVGVLWATVESLYQLDLGDRAAHAALLAFDLHRTQPDSPPPPPGWLGALVLHLHLADAPAAARRVAERYEEWIRENDLLHAFSQEPVGQAWPLVLELGRLPDDFPRLARAPLARSILDGGADLERAFTELAGYDPALARRCQELLWEKAPRLSDAFPRAVQALALTVAKPQAPTPPGTSPLLVLGGGVAVIIAIMFLGGLVDLAKQARPNDQSTRARAPLEALCSDPPEVGDHFCQVAGRAVEGLDEEGCGPRLAGRVAAVSTALNALPPPLEPREQGFRSGAVTVLLLLNEIQAQCGGKR